MGRRSFRGRLLSASLAVAFVLCDPLTAHSETLQDIRNEKAEAQSRKKEAEGKPKKVAKIAALNKFLRIYYARVSEVYAIG